MQCKENHKSHKLLVLADKYKLLTEHLKRFLPKSKSILEKLEGKHDIVENSWETTVKQLQSHYLRIQRELLEIHQDLISQMENEKQKELSRLDNTKNELKNIRQNIKKQLLDPSLSQNLVEQCEQMISLEKTLPKELSWRKPIYVTPQNESSSKEVLSKLLGHYETNPASFFKSSKIGEETSYSTQQKSESNKRSSLQETEIPFPKEPSWKKPMRVTAQNESSSKEVLSKLLGHHEINLESFVKSSKTGASMLNSSQQKSESNIKSSLQDIEERGQLSNKVFGSVCSNTQKHSVM